MLMPKSLNNSPHFWGVKRAGQLIIICVSKHVALHKHLNYEISSNLQLNTDDPRQDFLNLDDPVCILNSKGSKLLLNN